MEENIVEVNKIKKSIKKIERKQLILFILDVFFSVSIYTSIHGGFLSGGFPFAGFVFSGFILSACSFILFFISIKNIKNFQELKKLGGLINSSSLFFSYFIMVIFCLGVLSYLLLIIR